MSFARHGGTPSSPAPKAPFRIGLIADCQYAPVPVAESYSRQYLFSPQKLADGVAELNEGAVEFSLHFGRFDRPWLDQFPGRRADL